MTRDRPTARRAPRALVACAALLALEPACSFRYNYPAPARATWPNPVVPESSQERCTSSYGPAVVDTVLGGGLAGIAYVERGSGSHTITILLGLASIPFLVSAVYGYVQTPRCRDYQALFGQHP
jgi:hypothetical protein